MHGIPAHLSLSSFSGDQLEQVCVGSYEIQFRFASGAEISVEGKWELTDSAATVVDGADRDSHPYSRSGPLKVHLLLGQTVTRWTVNAPTFFSLQFGSGHTLSIFDDSQEYESFSIQPGNIYV